MARPVKTGSIKKATTISIDPKEWQDYQALVKAKVFPAISVSERLRQLIREDTARLTGEECAQPHIDLVKLQENQRTLIRKRDTLLDLVEKVGEDFSEDAQDMLRAYGCIPTSTGAEVNGIIARIMVDRKAMRGAVKEFFDLGYDLENLFLALDITQVAADLRKNTDLLAEAYEKMAEDQANMPDPHVQPEQEQEAEEEYEELEEELEEG